MPVFLQLAIIEETIKGRTSQLDEPIWLILFKQFLSQQANSRVEVVNMNRGVSVGMYFIAIKLD